MSVYHNKKYFILILLFWVGTSVTGCSSNLEHFGEGKPQVVASPDNVSSMLADAADRAATALENLSAIEKARSPAVAVAPIAGAPMELRRAMTINWLGPVEPVAKTLAARAGYSFAVVGVAPPVPVVVSLDAENKPIIELLRDLGLQLGVRGDIRVDSGRRLVELYYPPKTGVGDAY